MVINRQDHWMGDSLMITGMVQSSQAIHNLAVQPDPPRPAIYLPLDSLIPLIKWVPIIYIKESSLGDLGSDIARFISYPFDIRHGLGHIELVSSGRDRSTCTSTSSRNLILLHGSCRLHPGAAGVGNFTFLPSLKLSDPVQAEVVGPCPGNPHQRLSDLIRYVGARKTNSTRPRRKS